MANVPKRQHTVNARPASKDAAGGEALSELVALVFRLDGLLKTAGDALAEPAGQTTARWRILATVESGPMTVAQIAADWWLARQSVQRVADLLAHEGLVTYEENPAHRRAQLVRITPTGLSVLHRIRDVQRDWARTVAGRVGRKDVRKANQILARVIEALTSSE